VFTLKEFICFPGEQILIYKFNQKIKEQKKVVVLLAKIMTAKLKYADSIVLPRTIFGKLSVKMDPEHPNEKKSEPMGDGA
ncbi:hypothetical protein BLOT_009457, partial [Blomia tropicalis]